MIVVLCLSMLDQSSGLSLSTQSLYVQMSQIFLGTPTGCADVVNLCFSP